MVPFSLVVGSTDLKSHKQFKSSLIVCKFPQTAIPFAFPCHVNQPTIMHNHGHPSVLCLQLKFFDYVHVSKLNFS